MRDGPPSTWLRTYFDFRCNPVTLIDWPGVARNALWILGLSIVLAAWSYVTWDAGQRRVRLRHALNWPLLQVPVALGLLLFAVSLCWGAQAPWERCGVGRAGRGVCLAGGCGLAFGACRRLAVGDYRPANPKIGRGLRRRRGQRE